MKLWKDKCGIDMLELVFFLYMVFNFQFVDVLGGCIFHCGIVVMFLKVIVVHEL